MSSAPCPIWNTQAELLEKGGDFEVFDSPRAGGKYSISGTAGAQIATFTDRAKLLLTTWLCEQRRAGVEVPTIQSTVLDLIKNRELLSVPARLTAALLFLGNNIQELGDNFAVGGAGASSLQCSAYTESKNLKELNALYLMLKNMDLVEGAFSHAGFAQVRPTARGWQQLEELTRRKTDSSQVFVAMWFNDTMNDAYFNGIVPAISAAGYKAVRIDKKEHNNKIDDEIIAEIRRSRFVVADFTCEPKNARGGVYYEAGFARGLGIPVLWTCKDTSLDDLHFDTRQYAHIVWKNSPDLFTLVKNRIGATVGDGPLPKTISPKP